MAKTTTKEEALRMVTQFTLEAIVKGTGIYWIDPLGTVNTWGSFGAHQVEMEDFAAELARRAAPKVEPLKPREPKAGEWWRKKSTGKFYRLSAVKGGTLAFGMHDTAYWTSGPSAPFGYEAGDFEFYAASEPEYVAKRAAEMGICNKSQGHKSRFQRVWDECVKAGMAHSREDGGACSVLAFIRDLVAARKNYDVVRGIVGCNEADVPSAVHSLLADHVALEEASDLVGCKNQGGDRLIEAVRQLRSEADALRLKLAEAEALLNGDPKDCVTMKTADYQILKANAEAFRHFAETLKVVLA